MISYVKFIIILTGSYKKQIRRYIVQYTRERFIQRPIYCMKNNLKMIIAERIYIH